MRTISRLQLYALWFCVAYLGGVIALMRDAPLWAFTWRSSYLRELIPGMTAREPLLELCSVFDMLARILQVHTVLLALGALMLLATVIWISKSSRLSHDSQSHSHAA